MRTFLLAATAAAIALGASSLAQAQSRYVAPSHGFGSTLNGERFAFTDEERIAMRRHVRPRAQFGVTTGNAGGAEVAPGDRIPDTVLLHEFPAAVYLEAPRLEAYRYIQIGNRAYVVDPRDRIVVESID